MITLNIENTRSCKLTKNEEVRKGDNNISAFSIVFPSNFGAGHPRSECAVEMRCYLPNGEFLSYELDTSQPTATQPITYDLTEQEQQVSIMFIITHGVEVIGKTNTEMLYVYDAPDSDREPLTPRGDCDRVINEQRQTIASQAATIDEQSEQIEQDSETIGSLNNRVDELTSENEGLSEQNSIYLDTIKELNERVPAMETPEPVTPTSETQLVRPSEGYAGLASVTVDRVTAEGVGFNPDYYKEGEACLGKVGAYNPFPEHSYGGIYYTELGEGGYPKKILVKDMLRSASSIPQFFNASNDAKRELREVIFENCPGFLTTEAYLFRGFNYLTKVLLPDSLTSIGFNAFANCTSLTSITIPDSVTSIGESAFQDCTSLTELTLPDSLTSIGNSAFYGCTSLMELTLSDSLTSISNYAFQNCSALTELTLPGSLTSIGGNAFYNCTSLTEINLPDSLTRIGNSAFYGCTSLTSITIPDSVTKIGGSAFTNCTSLTNLTLAQGFNCNGLNVSASTRFTAETIVACLEALADRTGQTAYTITFGSTNLNKLTAEQKAIAIGKNWNLA